MKIRLESINSYQTKLIIDGNNIILTDNKRKKRHEDNIIKLIYTAVMIILFVTVLILGLKVEHRHGGYVQLYDDSYYKNYHYEWVEDCIWLVKTGLRPITVKTGNHIYIITLRRY